MFDENLVNLVQPPPPAARLQPYEVFINFRGEDTRNNFVGHLHNALKDRGIRTYFDEDNLRKGETIAPELVKAIEESSIAIVILSSNYGSSTWCMNELLKIMECKNKSGLVVFPIFYDVDPSHVRKHKVNLKNNGEKFEIWKKALEEVAGIAGEDICGKNEALCIKVIADKILKQLPVKASHFRKSCVGIEPRISKMKEAMHSKPEEVLFIGLWGMGGIGKTTTARAIFEDCKDEYEGSCFLQDVKESKNKMEKLQMDLLSDVLKTKFEGIRDVVTGSSMIQERLQFKRVLIVIDDVDNIQQLNALAKQCDWFGRGSRIIITTRDVHLIDGVHIETYIINTLPKKEALHLFCVHAFKNDHPREDLEDLSLKVLSYAGGLPLALRVLGDHLHQQPKYFWESTLKRLKNVPEDEIISKLKISFDGLTDFQKDIFLDIACYFRGNYVEEVEQRLGSLGLHPEEGITVLIQKLLIHIRWDRYNYRIEMHDLLQEMGWDIVRKKSEGDVTRYSRLWLKNDILEAISNITVSSEIERIYIHTHWDVDDDVIKANLGWEVTFRNMNKLSLLEISGDFFKGNYNVNDSQPFGQLGNKLRWFSWYGYPGNALPKSFHPRNLVHLLMVSNELEETPDFSYMPNLEVLNLSFSYKLVCVHPSLGNHMKIKRIHLHACESLVDFPNINRMKSLELLDLHDTYLRSFPTISDDLDSLRKLNLDGTETRASPRSNVKLQRCDFLHTLPISFLCRPKLQKSFIRSGSLKYFEETIDDEMASPQMDGTGQLFGSHIHFRHCERLEELPESLLSRIELLEVSQCRILAGWIYVKLVDLLGKYQHLSCLKLHQFRKKVPPEILQAFSEWESMSNMLREREKPFAVSIPRRQIPSWFMYQFSRPSVTMFLPPLYEWYTDKLRGFVISGINVNLEYKYMSSMYGHSNQYTTMCGCPESFHVVVMYIPVDNIRRYIGDWDRQNECTLLELNSSIKGLYTNMVEASPTWGLSLVYGEGEVNELDPHQVIIVTKNIPDSSHGTFRVKLAGNKDMKEKLNMDDYEGKYHSTNTTSWALLQQQSYLQAGRS